MAAIPIPDKVHLLDNRLKPKTFENRTVLELLKNRIVWMSDFFTEKTEVKVGPVCFIF